MMGIDPVANAASQGVITNIMVLIAALLTLGIFSFLYKDNPLYKFSEYLLVGVTAGYALIIDFFNSIKPNLIEPLWSYRVIVPTFLGDMTLPRFLVDFRAVDILYIIPGILGLMIMLRLFNKTTKWSRWPIAFYIGMFAGLNIPASIQAQLLEQVRGSILAQGAGGSSVPIFTYQGILEMFTRPNWDFILFNLNGILMFVGTLCVLSYFFFSMEHKGWLGGASRVGIYYLMLGFGASFGYTVMARVSILLGRVQFMIFDARYHFMALFGIQ
jgi:hypothetical protein